ncbi:alpha-2-macroglobulin [Pasteurella sp. PK-2025]|uniref:alpha-2-macroglobulin n=1 Tax=Pasteurella sp. PK-2025 TaxID=3413133 RepID=UPI003C764632
MHKRYFFSLLSLFALIFTLSGCWDNKQDDANAIGFTINPLEITNYEGSNKEVYPLVISFSGPAAPITAVNTEITQGLTITPEIKGKWFWNTDSILTFKPEQDWPAGQEYQVKIDQKILNPKQHYVQALKETQRIKTPDFNAQIHEANFHQDPNQAHIRHAIVHVTFTHPVARETFEKGIQVNLIRKNQDNTQHVISPLTFKVRYDDHDLGAWILSDSVNLAATNNQWIETKIQKNITALLGKNALKEDLVSQVAVPTKFSLSFHSHINVVNNEKNLAEQILRLQFNHGVKGKDIQDHLRAFLLPELNPNQQKTWQFNQVTQEILKQAQEVSFQLIPTTTPYHNVQNFRVDIPAQRCLYLYMTNQISAMGGYQFQNPVGNVVCAPDYPKYVGFVGKGSLLSTLGDKRLTFTARNFKKVQLDIGEIQPEQLRHIAALNEGDFQNPNLGELKFDNLARFHNQVYQIRHKKPQEASYFSVDLANALPSSKSNSSGVYWVKVSGFDDRPDNNEFVDTSHQYDWRNDGLNQYNDYRLVVVSDLGIIAKKAVDGSQMIFVQSIQSGQPIEGATVSVISRNGAIIENGLSNEDGVVTFGSLEKYTKAHSPVMYLVSRGEQFSFLPIKQAERVLDYSRFDIDGVMNQHDNASLKAYVFNDRGIYRPSENVHIGILTKSLDWKSTLDKVPLQFQISSPSGQTFLDKILRVDKSGLNAVSFTLPDNAETGEWYAEVFIGEEQNDIQIGSSTFQVQEFQPDTLKIRASFNQPHVNGWISPADLVATVDLTNLFGTPAQHREVRANLTLHSLFPKFSQYPDYHFFDNQRNQSAILYETELESKQTDSQGRVQYPLDLSHYAQNTTQMLYFTVDGFEADSGRSVSTVKSVMVSAQPWLLGYKSQHDLAYLKPNSEETVHLLAINPTLNAIAADKLKATLMQREYVSVLTQQQSGAYKYESQLVETEVEQTPIQLAQTGLDFKLNTQKAGDFVLVLTDENDQEVNRIYYSVVGNKNLAVSMDKNSELKLRLNKKQFQPNEEIEVAIQAPYTGSGLITIERDRVYAYKWFKSNTNSSVQRITLPANFEGSGYINVQFSRDIHSEDIFSSPLSYAVAPFSVNVDNHRLALKLTAPKMIKSGETATFTLQSDRPTKAIVYAVNEGILQVANYQFGDPLKYFFPKMALQVKTLQILDLILPEFNKIMQFAQTGGDTDEEMSLAARLAMANTNPFKRKADKPVAYWSDIIEVNGETSVQYPVPESFNGNLKVMALAISENGSHVGKAETQTTVRSDLILSPNAPLTLTPSDQSEMNVVIANNTQTSQKVNVKLHADPQLRIEEQAEKTVEIAPMSEAMLNFGLKATDTLGAAKVKITATYQNEQQQTATVVRHVNIAVRPTLPKQFVTQIGRVGAGKTLTQDLPMTLFPQHRQQQALFSPLPLVLAQGISTYLTQYDNYCTEQMISAAFPSLLLSQNKTYQPLLQSLSLSHETLFHAADADNIQRTLNKLLAQLPSRQDEFGHYGVWNNLESGNPFLTAYVNHFLIEAQERQATLPKAWFVQDGLFHKSMMALEENSQPKEGDSLSNLRQRAYSAYLLARLGQVPSNALSSIRTMLDNHFNAEDWQQDTTASWLAATYKLLKQDQQAEQLIQFSMKQLNQPRNVQWQYADYSDPLIQDSSMLYVIARHFPQHLANVSDTVLDRIMQDLNAQRYNTLSSAMVLLALDAYGEQQKGAVEKLNIKLANQPIGENKGIFHLAEIHADQGEITFANQSEQAAWFALSQQGYPQQVPEKAFSNGLEIHRTYTDKAGKPISKVKLGDVIKVTVKVRSVSQDFLPDVIVTDLYPAGFEVQWQSDTEEEGDDFWHITHHELREDRIVSYGDVTSELSTFVYYLKATNAGTYQIPAIYAESMYDRSLKAYSAKEGKIHIEK